MKENEFLLLVDMMKGLIDRDMTSEARRIAERMSIKLDDFQKSKLAKFMLGERLDIEKRELIRTESYDLGIRMTEYDYF